MKRRHVLTALGASLSVAGCLSAGPTATETDSTTPDMTDTPFRIGGSNADVTPHDLTVRNDGNTSRVVTLQIRNLATDETLLDTRYSIGSGSEIHGELRGPATYEVRVTLDDTAQTSVTSVDYFDTCNEYGTIITISVDGSITSETMRTDVECDTESV